LEFGRGKRIESLWVMYSLEVGTASRWDTTVEDCNFMAIMTIMRTSEHKCLAVTHIRGPEAMYDSGV
jgi:hypothetical protein